MHGMCTVIFALTRVLENLINTWLIQRSNQVIRYCFPSTASCLFFFLHGATAPRGPGPPHYRVFTITLRHATLSMTSLDE
jgi:hypothetical protein